MGLSIARHLIEKLGEKITVESKLGEGTSFRFTLKKYVSNAIALGPPSDDWEQTADGLPPIIQPQETRGRDRHTQDAPYEVIPQKEKHNQRIRIRIIKRTDKKDQ